MKKIAILGSTGSIGTQTLSVIEEHADDFEVTVLACGNNIRLLEEQMRKFRPKIVAVWSKEAAASLKIRTADLGIPVETGMDGLLAVATYEEAEERTLQMYQVYTDCLNEDLAIPLVGGKKTDSERFAGADSCSLGCHAV